MPRVTAFKAHGICNPIKSSVLRRRTLEEIHYEDRKIYFSVELTQSHTVKVLITAVNS